MSVKKIITKSHGIIQCEIDEDLQKCNPLAIRGIYLVEVENGIVWGYDYIRYEMDDSNAIIRRPDLTE
jgi:hypothetical protein